jgi:hypothetical protein
VGSLLKFVLTALAASSQTSTLQKYTGRLAAALVLAGIAVLMACAAWGCFCAALWIELTPALGPVGAPLVVAAVCIVSGGVLALFAWELTHRRRASTVASDLNLDALLADASRLINEHKGAALLAAVLLGMLAGTGNRRR